MRCVQVSLDQSHACSAFSCSFYPLLRYYVHAARTEDRLRELALDHAGYFTSKAATAAGVSPKLVVQLAHRGRFERVAQGLYRFSPWSDADVAQYHEAVLWPQVQRDLDYAVISHDSALELYGLTNLNPGHTTSLSRRRRASYADCRRGSAFTKRRWNPTNVPTSAGCRSSRSFGQSTT